MPRDIRRPCTVTANLVWGAAFFGVLVSSSAGLYSDGQTQDICPGLHGLGIRCDALH